MYDASSSDVALEPCVMKESLSGVVMSSVFFGLALVVLFLKKDYFFNIVFVFPNTKRVQLEEPY